MKIKYWTIALLLLTTATLAAQQRKIIRPGMGANPDLTKDWPKMSAVTSNAGDADLTAAVNTYVDALVARDLFSGTVLVARDGKPLFFKSYGLANKDTATPNTNDTKYNIGSINKIFTRTALLQLRDEGKIDFTKPLRTYLPDYPSDIADRVTIQQLLDMTSGMGDIFGPEFDATPKDRLRSLNDYARLFANKPLEFEPGTSRRYSNAGYIVLGLVIEKLSGMSYYDYVHTKIFAPLGMTDTAYYAQDEIVPRRATGYAKGEDGVRHTNVFTLPGRGSSAGGGYSTATDLLRFVTGARKWIGGAVGFGGGAPGLNAAVETEDRWAIVVLSNYDPPTAEEVAANLRRGLGIGGE
ncbi:MAG TPA: serine hydrolase domain-containing protein [Thermoanaerobaculia bacterium]|nr:serine hydrolase domain-containing protein [Thermoanaerobaculia bacterium]